MGQLGHWYDPHTWHMSRVTDDMSRSSTWYSSGEGKIYTCKTNGYCILHDIILVITSYYSFCTWYNSGEEKDGYQLHILHIAGIAVIEPIINSAYHLSLKNEPGYR